MFVICFLNIFSNPINLTNRSCQRTISFLVFLLETSDLWSRVCWGKEKKVDYWDCWGWDNGRDLHKASKQFTLELKSDCDLHPTSWILEFELRFQRRMIILSNSKRLLGTKAFSLQRGHKTWPLNGCLGFSCFYGATGLG